MKMWGLGVFVVLVGFFVVPSVHAQEVSPEDVPFACLGACPGSTTASDDSMVSVHVATPTPCPADASTFSDDSQVEAQHNKNKKKSSPSKSKQSEKDGLLEILLKFLQFFLQLIGGGTAQPPHVTTPASPPSPHPCPPAPTLEPTIEVAPIPEESSPSTQPTIQPTQSADVGAAVQPRASVPRPGGGQWAIAFRDEFDSSGGTTADAMSGANFVNKTVGGGTLTGNPGLNPRKWNMGWQTGPSTLTGLGNVTKITAWGGSETQWWGPESIIFPGDGAIHLRSQRKTWTSYNNEMGMISTAGLYAANPANSSHGNVPADRFIDGPQILEWTASGTYIVDWPAMWMTNGGNFGNAGKEWPGGTTYSEEIDLVEPIFRLHKASEFNKGKQVVPPGWDRNAKLTWTWYFDTAKIIMWVTNESGQTVKLIDLPDSEVTAAMITAQWKYPQYFMFAQQSKIADPGDGDMAIEYVRIWK